MKKVLFIIIDALASRLVEPAIQDGKLPNISKLIEAGGSIRDCYAVFPSITPAATCSLVTGCYPLEHGILGAHWYDRQEEDVAYFGDDFWVILNEGIEQYVVDFQHRLNNKRLQVPTIFEQVEKHGRYRDAVINLLWFRGTVEHEVSWPALLKPLPGTGASSMNGPHYMFMADFVNSPLSRGQQLRPRGGISRRFGFHDETSGDYLLQLAEQEALPDLTVAYFPNNDFDSHKLGPEAGFSNVTQFDEVLGQLFELCGGVTNMLQEYAVLITGDHSQSELITEGEPAIDLSELLAEFNLTPAGARFESNDQVMLCPNMRAAQIYFGDQSWRDRERLTNRLVEAEGIDQLIWCEADEGLAEDIQTTHHVVTRDRGSLSFRVANHSDAMGSDEFGGRWRWSGDLRAVDASVDANAQLQYADYPNAFERIATAFHEKGGNCWITAALGREFRLPDTHCSERGSHGSLHVGDSISPVVASGLPSSVELPKQMRSVDLTPLCLQILGIQSQREPGQSHVAVKSTTKITC